MTFEELFQLKEFKEGRLIAGEEELEREIRGSHVIEMADGTNWAEYGSLIFTSGVGFQEPEQELMQLIQTLARKQAAGLVVEVGPYIETISEEIIRCAKQWQLPLFTLPYRISVSGIISKIYHHVYQEKESRESMERLVREVIYEQTEEAYEKMRSYGFLEDRSHVVVYLSVKEEQGLDRLVHAVQMAFSEQKDMWIVKERQAMLLICQLYEEGDSLRSLMERKHQAVEKSCGDEVFIGISDGYVSIEQTKECVKQAKRAVQLAKKENKVWFYEDLGIYQMFFQIQDKTMLHRMLQQYLGSLLLYDEENGTELVETLKVFLEHNASITKTTEAMYVHRNTIKYRIKRIEEITQKDLQDPEVQFHLRLAFKLLYFVE